MFVNGEPPGEADVEVVQVVVVVSEISDVQAELLVAKREILYSGTAVQIIVAGGEYEVVGDAVCVYVGGAVALITHLGAEVPFAQREDGLADEGPVRQPVGLAESGAVDEVHVDHQFSQVEAVAQGEPVHLAVQFVFHQVVAPGGGPAGADVAVPVQVVGVGVLGAGGDGRCAELGADVLARCGRPGTGYAKGIILIQTAGEGSVIIYVNGRGIHFVAAHQDGLLAGGKGPFGVDLPFEPEEVRGVEGVLLVYLLVEALADAEAEIVREMTHNVQVEIISLEVGIVFAGADFLVEGGAGVYGNLVHVLFHGLQRLVLRPGLRAAQDPQHRNQN